MELQTNNNPINLGKITNKETRTKELKKREDFLRSIGFSDEQIEKTKKYQPTLHDPFNAQEIINFLKSTGFEDVEKRIISKPSILTLSLENIKKTISDLKSIGFNNPAQMIITEPSIAGLSIDNIKNRVKTLENIFKLYGINIEAKYFIEKTLAVLGTKIDKIWTIARILKTLDFNPNKISVNFLTKLLFANITDATVVASILSNEGKNFTKQQILDAIEEIKDVPKEEKNVIANDLSSKLGIRHNRGYGQ